MKKTSALLGCLLVTSVAQAQSISLVNQGFELPGTVKTEYWDAAGTPVPGAIPGWAPSGNGVQNGGPIPGPGDSGVESGSIGLWQGFLAAQDPSIYQTTGYNILGSEAGFTLTLAARDIYTSDVNFGGIPNSAVLNLSLYYLDGGNRVSLGNQDSLLTGSYGDYTLTVNSIPLNAIGKPLGIELDNVADLRDLQGDVVNSWFALDDVRLSVVPEPASAALLGVGLGGLAIFRRRRH